MKKVITRRDFIRGTTAAVLGAAIGLPAQETKKTRVILIRHRDALDENSKFNAEIIQQMLDEALMALTDQNDPVKAFQKFIKPGEVVGIKSNEWPFLPTPKELENAIERRVIDAGVKKQDIGIDDRRARHNPIFQKATSLINVRHLRSHDMSGIGTCLKNYIMFAESPAALHPNNCANLGECFHYPMTKGKTRLNILCVLTPLYHGRGPHHFNRRYVWNYKGIIVSKDPVPVDTIGLQLITAKRREKLGEARAVPPVPSHIKVADKKYGLGTSDINKIELIKLGWKEDILI